MGGFIISLRLYYRVASQSIIKKLENDAQLLDDIMKWVVASGHDKRYKRCVAGLSEQCLKVDAVELFHGKHCAECRVVYQARKYQERKTKKNKSQSK